MVVSVFVLLVVCGPASAVDVNGLVAHWAFDEVSGTIAYDSAGENDGTFVGDPVWTTGQVGGALEFDGDGDHVDCGTGSSLDVTDAITIAAWIKRPDFNSHGVIAGKTNGDLVTAGYGLYSYEEGVAFNFYASGDWVRTEPRIPISADEWHYVVGGFDGTGSYVYIDGEQMASVEYFGTITTADGYPFQIGFWRLDNPEYFKGLMDDVRVYNRALSGEEIRQLYYEGFSDYERAVMRVANAIDQKEWALELVDAAMVEEADAHAALEELLDSKDYGELGKSDIIKARQRIHSAIQHQEQSAGALERGVEQLEDALLSLGWEPEPEPNEPEPVE